MERQEMGGLKLYEIDGQWGNISKYSSMYILYAYTYINNEQTISPEELIIFFHPKQRKVTATSLLHHGFHSNSRHIATAGHLFV